MFRTSGTVVCKLRNRCFQRAPFCVSVRRYRKGCRLLIVWWSRLTTVGDRLAVFSKAGYAGSPVPVYPLNVKSQSSQSLPGAYGSGFQTLMSSGRGFDTESCHRCVHRSARRLLTNFNHLRSELIELTSQHLNFLSRCHRHSISQYQNTRNISVPQFQDNRLATMQEWETTQNVFKCAVLSGCCELFSRDPTWAQDV